MPPGTAMTAGPPEPPAGEPSAPIAIAGLNRTIRHRLRNFCGGATMAFDYLGRQVPTGDAQAAACLAALENEVDDLLEYSRRLDLLIEPLPPAMAMTLHDCLDNAVALASRRFPRCRFDLQTPAGQVIVPTGTWLLDLLRELVTNAIEAQDDAPVVVLHASASPDLRIRVSNPAAATAREVLAHPPAVPGPARGGHDGLGLGIAHRLSLALPGRLTVDDVPGSGWFHATVTVALPPAP